MNRKMRIPGLFTYLTLIIALAPVAFQSAACNAAELAQKNSIDDSFGQCFISRALLLSIDECGVDQVEACQRKAEENCRTRDIQIPNEIIFPNRLIWPTERTNRSPVSICMRHVLLGCLSSSVCLLPTQGEDTYWTCMTEGNVSEQDVDVEVGWN